MGAELTHLRAAVRRLDRRIAKHDEQAVRLRAERRRARRALRDLGVTWAALADLSDCSTTAIHRDLQTPEARARENTAKNEARRVNGNGK